MKEQVRKTFWFNLLMVFVLCGVLYIIFFASLSLLTRHYSEVKVPNVTGRDVKMAVTELERLGFDVDIDSAYEPTLKKYLVLSQIPEVNATVKKGRTIFITVNKAEPPVTPMPNLLNLSFRSALMILKSNKLNLGDTIFKPDIAKGAVLDQLYMGVSIRPGQMVPQGSKIDLVVGDGLGNTEFNVPDVIGMTYQEAIAVLNANGLQFTTIWDGGISDSATAIVYRQTPRALNELMGSNRIKEGDYVDIRIKQNPTPEELENNRTPEGAVTEEEELQ
jgi:beta-lactam-binding protein with PASTA domain